MMAVPNSVSDRQRLIDEVRMGVAEPPPVIDESTSETLAATFVERYGMRPDLFASEILGLDLDSFQTDVALDVASGERQIAVRSAHGVGKSTTLAVIALWFLLFRYRCKVVMTAPTSGQLFDSLLAETKSLMRRCPDAVRSAFEVKSDRIEFIGQNEDVFLTAVTSSKDRPEALSGRHSDNVLLIADEASGVPDAVFNAAGGSMSGDNRVMIMTGNPTRLIGRFAKAFNDRNYREKWKRYHVGYKVEEAVSSDGCRHYASKRITDEYAESVAAEHGVDSNEYAVRVRGDFPGADLDSYIAASLVISAMQRDIDTPLAAKKVWACDPARYGADSTSIGERRGPVVTWITRRKNLDTMQVAGWVKALYDEQPEGGKPVAILIDVIGIGAGVYDRLREQGLPVAAVNVAESPIDPSAKCMRLRDELYKRLRDWLKSMMAKLPVDDDLLADLTKLRYTYSSDGRLKIESKEELRSRGEASPDKGDVAAMLTLYDDYKMHSESDSYRNWSTPIERGLRVTV